MFFDGSRPKCSDPQRATLGRRLRQASQANASSMASPGPPSHPSACSPGLTASAARSPQPRTAT
eukprot:11151386-Alexandrium_andersonii.AAC.1